MLSGKDFTCRNLYGEYLDKNPYRNGYDFVHASQNLSQAGKDLLKKFIDQNKEKDRKMKEREEQLYKEYHSKRNNSALNIGRNQMGAGGDSVGEGDKKIGNNRPLWKYGLHVIEEFGPSPFDRYHLYDEPIKRKYNFVQPPFRRPKEEGDYFDRDIHILGGPYEKVAREKVVS